MALAGRPARANALGCFTLATASKLVSIAWAVDQYRGEGFNAGGRKPTHTVFGDWLKEEASTKGRTLGIGNRSSGKYARIYEKGKQLGKATNPWTRIEVEWRAQDRYIPYDVLTRPGHYSAGAYPCLAFLTEEQFLKADILPTTPR